MKIKSFISSIYSYLIDSKLPVLSVLLLFVPGCFDRIKFIGTYDLFTESKYTQNQDQFKIYITPDKQIYFANVSNLEEGEIYEASILKISEDWEIPAGFSVVDLQEQIAKDEVFGIATEARQYVGSMNRAQQASYIEKLSFTGKFEDLGLGVNSETTFYSYKIIPSESRVINFAQAKENGLLSVLGIVYTAGPSTASILCQSLGYEPLMPKILSVTDCPEGWSPIN